MTDGNALPNKENVAHALLLKGVVFVHLDPRGEDVVVPNWLKRQPQLVLSIGLDLPVPIPDLRVDEQGIFGTLSFNRAAFRCSVPWDAVFAMVGDDGRRGMVWPASMPAEIAAEVEREAQRAQVTNPDAGSAAERGPQANRPERRRRNPGSRSPRQRPAAVAPPPTSAKRAGAKPATTKPAAPPSLSVIAGQGERSNDDSNSAGERRPRRPHLRLVK